MDAYWSDLDGDGRVGDLFALLDDPERERAARFRFERDRRRFIRRRGILRTLLAVRLSCDPATLRFICNAYGKPELQGSDLRFNASHSHGTALFTLASGSELGCDIELDDGRLDYEGIAGTLFSPGEVQALEQHPPDQRRGGFFRCWTRKEAFVKAIGTGLSHPLGSFDTSPEGAVAGWSILSFEPRPRYHAAVAAEGGVDLALRQH